MRKNVKSHAKAPFWTRGVNGQFGVKSGKGAAHAV